MAMALFAMRNDELQAHSASHFIHFFSRLAGILFLTEVFLALLV